jgi:hypothetical protein
MIPRLTTKTVIGQKTYNFGFDYLSKDFIKVEINGTTLEYPKDYSVEGTSVNLTVSPIEVLPLLIYRSTSTLPMVEWKDSSIMRADDLNIQQKQTQHLSEELAFRSQEAIKSYEVIVASTDEVKRNTEEVREKTNTVITKSAEVENKAQEVATNANNAQQKISIIQAHTQMNDKYYSDTLTIKSEVSLKADEVKRNTDMVSALKRRSQEILEENQRLANQVRQVAGGDYYTKSEVDQKIQTEATEALKTLVGTAPQSLDTLQELATALGNDPNFATTMTNLIGTKTTLQQVYPIGSIYTSTVNTNPSILFGFGSWEAIEGGRVLLANGNGYIAGSTGGSSTHTLKVEELPRHNHGGGVTQSGAHGHTGTASSNGTHSHTVYIYTAGVGSGNTKTFEEYRVKIKTDKRYITQMEVEEAGTHTHDIQINNSGNHTHGIPNQGDNKAHNIMQPYLVVYIWKRTA